MDRGLEADRAYFMYLKIFNKIDERERIKAIYTHVGLEIQKQDLYR